MTCDFCGGPDAMERLTLDGKNPCWPCWRRLVLDPYEARKKNRDG